MHWHVVVPWPYPNKRMLERWLRQECPEWNPGVKGAGGARYDVSLDIPASAARDEDAVRRCAVDALTKILGEPDAGGETINASTIAVTAVDDAPREPETVLAVEQEAPLEAEVVPLPDQE